jgi:hypothetical protein
MCKFEGKNSSVVKAPHSSQPFAPSQDPLQQQHQDPKDLHCQEEEAQSQHSYNNPLLKKQFVNSQD